MSGTGFTDVTILAGGIGERLWPASQPDYPKQFLTLASGVSFLQAAVLRALALEVPGKILVITRRDLVPRVSEQCMHLLDQCTEAQRRKLFDDLCIIAEPCARHTCAPIMLACRLVELEATGGHTMLVLASDHVIGPEERFAADCRRAARAAQDGNFVCFAIEPNEPSTGYGYIRRGERTGNDDALFRVAQFKEKPDEKTARAYLESGEYFWNSGMFAFTTAFFAGELKACAPGVYDAFLPLEGAPLPEPRTINGIRYVSDWAPLEEVYRTVPAVAVDTAVAEKTSHAVAVRATFDWDDVGSWDAFGKLFSGASASTVEIKGGNNFVYSDIPVALCGVSDLVVVIKNGNALIMRKGSSGMMREVVKKVKNG